MKVKQISMIASLGISGLFLWFIILSVCGTLIYNCGTWWDNIRNTLPVMSMLFVGCITITFSVVLALIMLVSLFLIPMGCVKIYDIWNKDHV